MKVLINESKINNVKTVKRIVNQSLCLYPKKVYRNNVVNLYKTLNALYFI